MMEGRGEETSRVRFRTQEMFSAFDFAFCAHCSRGIGKRCDEDGEDEEVMVTMNLIVA